MANGNDKAKAKRKQRNGNGAPVIDPTDPQAQRRFQIQERGGLYSDRIKYDPWKRNYPRVDRTRT